MHLIGLISLHTMEGVSSLQFPPHSRGESSEKGTKYGGMCTTCEEVCNKGRMYCNKGRMYCNKGRMYCNKGRMYYTKGSSTTIAHYSGSNILTPAISIFLVHTSVVQL